MNGEINPNENRMGGFGKGKNYMHGGGGGGVNMADILPKDPFAKENAEQNSRWNTQSKQAHAQKQAQIQAEQDQFVPEAFKRDGAMNLDIKGNKSQGKATTWLDNNSKLDSNNPSDPQNTGISKSNDNNNNNQNNNPYGNNNNNNPYGNNNNNSNPYGNNNNNPYGNNNNNNPYGNNNNNNGGFGGNNNMNNNNNFNNNNNNNNNGGYGGNNNNMNNNNNSQPQNISFNPNPSNNNNNNFGGGNNNNMNQNNNNGGNNYEAVDPNINRPKGPKEQPVPQPYYSNKQKDPFAKFLDNSNYQRDLKNHGTGNQGGYQQMKQPNYKQYNAKPKKNDGNNFHTGNKESPYMLPNANKFSQPIRSICTKCGKPVQDSWTEDAKQRMYHNECFVCIECGVTLGPLGKYVTIGRGVVCKPCRNRQVLAAQAQEKY